jgi:hypothetical protein
MGEQPQEGIARTSSPCHHRRHWEGSVPHSQRAADQMSTLSGFGLLGFWDVGVGGMIGTKGGGQIGSVHKQPGKREDDSCHSWRAQVSGKRHKGD